MKRWERLTVGLDGVACQGLPFSLPWRAGLMPGAGCMDRPSPTLCLVEGWENRHLPGSPNPTLRLPAPTATRLPLENSLPCLICLLLRHGTTSNLQFWRKAVAVPLPTSRQDLGGGSVPYASQDCHPPLWLCPLPAFDTPPFPSWTCAVWGCQCLYIYYTLYTISLPFSMPASG